MARSGAAWTSTFLPRNDSMASMVAMSEGSAMAILMVVALASSGMKLDL
jgi:hypothetical protein